MQRQPAKSKRTLMPTPLQEHAARLDRLAPIIAKVTAVEIAKSLNDGRTYNVAGFAHPILTIPAKEFSRIWKHLCGGKGSLRMLEMTEQDLARVLVWKGVIIGDLDKAKEGDALAISGRGVIANLKHGEADTRAKPSKVATVKRKSKGATHASR